jgi:hypothetical protein
MTYLKTTKWNSPLGLALLAAKKLEDDTKKFDSVFNCQFLIYLSIYRTAFKAVLDI